MNKYIALICLWLFSAGCTQNDDQCFTLWQVPSQGPSQMNCYVLQADNGKVVVLDGGTRDDAPYLRGFLAALGNEVEMWLITHPHPDHMDALCEILEYPGDIVIREIYHSSMSPEQLGTEPGHVAPAERFYDLLDRTDIPVTDLNEAGREFTVGSMEIKVLAVTDRSMIRNAYNNASIVLKVSDPTKSVLLLGDAGIEQGQALLDGPYRGELDCDYIQMAHHGQAGCDENFYRTVKFRACLWPTPLWVWNNDVGEGFDTAWMETIQTRRWMEELGITEHYIAWQGLARIY